jgi:TonB family protein
MEAAGSAAVLRNESEALDNAASRRYDFLVAGTCTPESLHVRVELSLWDVVLRKKLGGAKAEFPRTSEMDAALSQPLGNAPASKSPEENESGFRAGRDETTIPECIYCPNPNYDSRSLHTTGSVVVRVLVTAEGRAENITIIKFLDRHLDEAAVEAIRKWKFKPATRDGKPVAVWTTIQVSFRLVP